MVKYIHRKNLTALNFLNWSQDKHRDMNQVITICWIVLMVIGETNAQADNQLTAAEKKAGWKLLFDGKSTKGWKCYGKDAIGPSWVVADGALTLKEGPDGTMDGGDIMTKDQYENYEFSIDWKISECGNSGIIFNVVEDEKYERTYHTGPEMQVLDNTCHPDAKIHTHRAGDLYDMIACSEEVVNPAGEWNHVLIRINKGESTFTLNGTEVVSFTMFDDGWNKMIAESKFKDMPGFGKYKKGHIALQDHSDEVSYKNIKIKKL